MRSLPVVIILLLLSFLSGWFGGQMAFCQGVSSSQADSGRSVLLMKEYRAILKSFNLENMQFEIDNSQEIESVIERMGVRSFAQALSLALVNLMYDSRDEESPLANARYALELLSKESHQKKWLSPERIRHVRYFLKRKLQKQSTKLRLVTSFDSEASPERGESTKLNWVFHLVIPSLSDHQYWVIVPKSSYLQPYNYGFN